MGHQGSTQFSRNWLAWKFACDWVRTANWKSSVEICLATAATQLGVKRIAEKNFMAVRMDLVRYKRADFNSF